MKQQSFNTLFGEQKNDQECKKCKKIEAEFDQLRQDHLKTQEENDFLKKQMESKSNDSQSKDGDMKKLRNQNNQLQKDLDLLKQQVASQENELVRRNDIINQLKELNDQLKQQKEELLFVKPQEQDAVGSAQLNYLKQHLRDATLEKEKALSYITQLQVEIQKLKLALAQPRVQEKQISNQQQDPDIEILKQENNVLSQRVTSLIQQLQKFQNDHQKQENYYKEEIRKLLENQSLQDQSMNESQSLEIKIKNLNQAQRDQENKMKQQQQALDYSKKKLEQSYEEQKNLLKQIEELKSQSIQQNVQAQNSDDEEIIDKDKYEQLKKQSMIQIQFLKTKLQESDQKYQKLEYLIKQQQNGEQILMTSKMIQEYQALKKKLSDIESKNKDNDKTQQLQDDTISLKLHIKNQTQQIENQEKQIQSLYKQLKDTQTKQSQQLKDTEEELIKAKIKMGNLMNIAMEYGAVHIIDKFIQQM